MRALIRNEGETVVQDMGLTFIDWDTGAPLTNPDWFGGPYVLIENYDPVLCEVVNSDEFTKRAGVEIANTETEFTIQERGTGINHVNTPAPETRSSESEGAVTESPSTVTIDGKTYTKEELLALLNQTS